MDHTVLPATNTMSTLPRKHSPDGAIMVDGTAAQYLTELCSRCDDTQLRSTTWGNFAVCRTCLRVSDKAVLVAGPGEHPASLQAD